MKIALLAAVFAAAVSAQRVDFERQVKPALNKYCLPCHDADKPAGNLRMDNMDGFLKGGSKGPAMAPTKPADSLMVKLIELPKGTPLAMPPDGPMPKPERDAIREWIAMGATWPRGTVLGKAAPPGPDEPGHGEAE